MNFAEMGLRIAFVLASHGSSLGARLPQVNLESQQNRANSTISCPEPQTDCGLSASEKREVQRIVDATYGAVEYGTYMYLFGMYGWKDRFPLGDHGADAFCKYAESVTGEAGCHAGTGILKKPGGDFDVLWLYWEGNADTKTATSKLATAMGIDEISSSPDLAPFTWDTNLIWVWEHKQKLSIGVLGLCALGILRAFIKREQASTQQERLAQIDQTARNREEVRQTSIRQQAFVRMENLANIRERRLTRGEAHELRGLARQFAGTLAPDVDQFGNMTESGLANLISHTLGRAREAHETEDSIAQVRHDQAKYAKEIVDEANQKLALSASPEEKAAARERKERAYLILEGNAPPEPIPATTTKDRGARSTVINFISSVSSVPARNSPTALEPQGPIIEGHFTD